MNLFLYSTFTPNYDIVKTIVLLVGFKILQNAINLPYLLNFYLSMLILKNQKNSKREHFERLVM